MEHSTETIFWLISGTLLRHTSLLLLFFPCSAEHDEEKLNNLLDHLLSTGIVSDGTVANSPSHQQQLWPLRERIAEALMRDGYCYKYDISLPYDTFYQRYVTR